jgi:hypothetical protein
MDLEPERGQKVRQWGERDSAGFGEHSIQPFV